MCETIFEKLTQKWHFRSKLFGNSSVVTQPRSDPVRWRKVRLPDRTGSGTSGPGPESGPAVRSYTTQITFVKLINQTRGHFVVKFGLVQQVMSNKMLKLSCLLENYHEEEECVEPYFAYCREGVNRSPHAHDLDMPSRPSFILATSKAFGT